MKNGRQSRPVSGQRSRRAGAAAARERVYCTVMFASFTTLLQRS
jgi:hypothetical protein